MDLAGPDYREMMAWRLVVKGQTPLAWSGPRLYSGRSWWEERMYWIFLAGAMVAAVFGQALLKGGSGAGTFVQQLMDLRTILGLGCYGGSALLYMVALRGIPLSIALPATAMSYIAVAMIGHFVFHEPIGPQRMAGLAQNLAGVVVLGTS